MNIIITVNKFNPNFDGVQFVTHYLAKGLVELGHHVIVITSSFTRIPAEKEEVIDGIVVYRLPIQTKHTFHLGNKKEYQSIIVNKCKDTDCLINVGTQSPFTDWLFPVLDKIQCKKILYLHSIWDFKWHLDNFSSLKSFSGKILANFRWRLYYFKNKKSFLKYNKVTQLHEKDYSNTFFQKKYGINSVIIENAADSMFFTEKKVNISLPYKRYGICVANFIERKNQWLAIDSFLKSNIDPTIVMVFIGSKKTKYLEQLQKKTIKLRKKLGLKQDLKRIDFLFGIPRETVSEYVKGASFYLLTSKWEAYPISLIESMAAGVPFISTDVGIVKYLGTGIVSSKKDLTFWIEKINDDVLLHDSISFIEKKVSLEKYQIVSKVKQLNDLIMEVCSNEARK